MMQKENLQTLLGILLFAALIVVAVGVLLLPFILWGLGIIEFKVFIGLALLWISLGVSL